MHWPKASVIPAPSFPSRGKAREARCGDHNTQVAHLCVSRGNVAQHGLSPR